MITMLGMVAHVRCMTIFPGRMQRTASDRYQIGTAPTFSRRQLGTGLTSYESPDEIRGVINEVIDELDPKGAPSKKVRRYLKDCVDTVSASYGSEPGEAMAPILAAQVCRWLAEKLGGIIRDPCGDWYELGEWPDLKPL